MIEVDRSEWRRVRFGDAVQSITDRVDDPSTAGVERYVGLEHLDAGSLTINRWGSPADVAATKLRFGLGDVVFARRRAYQRKLGQADFEGIASAHSLVLRARPGTVLPEYLPVFLSSDVFMDRAIQISVGSLSPTVNWKTLAVQEFELPPLEQQKRIADLMWSLDLLRRASAARRGSLAAAVSTYVDLLWQSGAERAKLSSLGAEISYGTSRQLSTERRDGFAPVLRIPNVVGGLIDLRDLKFLSMEQAAEADEIRSGDLLVVRTNGNPDLVGRGAVFEVTDEKYLYASYLLRVRLADGVLPEYLNAVWSSRSMRSQMAPYIRSSAGNYNLSASNLAAMQIPLLSETEQERWLSGLRPMTGAITESLEEGSTIASLARSLLQSILGGPE